MIEGFSNHEIADSADALRRRRCQETDKLRPDPPWATLSGFADRFLFYSALARGWPMFPLTGDYTMIFKIVDWNVPLIPMATITRAIPSDELA